eukprot:Sspe_Gene.36959::Locus_17858_Transcript_1_2_Confidence_0.750_Length_1737::g.36959::m.36959/K15430/TRM11, TRMT11; tRNA (guanine10-N2)-methyltransferase
MEGRVELLLFFACRPELSSFREAELYACARACKTTVELVGDLPDDGCFVKARFESIEKAAEVGKRMVLLHGIYEILGEGPTYEEVVAQVVALPDERIASFRHKSFKYFLEAFGSKYTIKEKVERFERFAGLRLEGKAEMKNPEVKFWIIEDIGIRDAAKESEAQQCSSREEKKNRDLKWVYHTIEVTCGNRSVLDKYSLKRRAWIGTTTMMPEYCFLMANQACVEKGDLVYDPFCGTGSTLVSCAHFGADVMGSDLDGRALGTMEKGIRSNCKQYGFKPAEILRMDIAKLCFKRQPIFDAIMCDPPYGRRESRKKIDSERQDVVTAYVKGLTPEQQKARVEALEKRYIPPPKTEYRMEQLVVDLIDIAAKMLVVGGRLVYWHPTTAAYDPSELATNPCLKVVADCGQSVTIKLKRRLITMEKVKEWEEGDETVPPNSEGKDFHFKSEAHDSEEYLKYRQKKDAKRHAIREFYSGKEDSRPKKLSKSERRQLQEEQIRLKREMQEKKGIVDNKRKRME